MKARTLIRAAHAHLALVALLSVTFVPPVRASFTASDFLKTSGILIKKNSGTGATVDLHGTNLGGWLTQENWMSPQGDFALDRTGWSASASVGSSASNAIDGDGSTGWSTAVAQAAGQWFQLDLARPHVFNQIAIDAGSSTGNYPRGYQVLVSNDGSTWTDVATGAGTQAFTTILFAPQSARYIRIVQTGSASSPWSIAEINLYSLPVLDRSGWTATASSSGSGLAPANALDANVATRWSTGANQAAGQWFQVDMGSNQSIGSLLIDAGPSSAGDYPAGYQVQLSYDGTNWFGVTPGTYGNGRITTVSFNGYTLRYFRIMQTASSSTNWWSIAEVVVFSGGNINRAGWTVTASSTDTYGDVASHAIDADTGTRWASGVAQAGGQWFQVDMGSNQTFNQIVLDSGAGSTGDYPRGYTVQVSNDASTWTQVASGQGYHEMLPINFPPVSARYIKLTQTGTSGSWWSIADLNVYLNVDENDQRIALYGRFGASAAATLINGFQDNWLGTADLDHLQAMGMNFVRVPFHYLDLINPDNTWRSDAFTRLDWIVDQCNSRNIYVLLDFHVPQGGVNPWASGGQIGPMPNGFWTNTACQDQAVAVWQGIAAHYNGNPAVAGYEILNEGIVAFSESTAQHTMKNDFYDRCYQAIRAIDPDHMIYLDAFFDYSYVDAPGVRGWSNVVYELHPYDFGDNFNWDGQSNVVTNVTADLVAKQNDPAWGVPIYMGEYCFFNHLDVWQRWMAALNALHVSWTNWSYKVRGLQSETGGGNWGFYNTNTHTVPVLNSDSSSTIASKWTAFATSSFTANTGLIDAVAPLAAGRLWVPTVPLDQTGWTASASSSGSGDTPGNALDWNSSTRWSTGAAQSGGQWFQVNLGAKKVFDQISLETRSGDDWDFPQAYQIQVSGDGSTWTTVGSGTGFGHKMVLPFAPQYAQYVRVVQTGAATNWWSIAEFHVYSELALDRAGWTATASATESGGSTGGALDGSAGTRWSTGAAQAAGQWYQVDLAKLQTFNRVLIDAAGNASDYARGYQIQVSTDAATWTTVASGTGSGASILVQFPTQTARYLKINQTGSSTSWWSIAELQVYGEWEYSRTGWTTSASATESGGSTANAIDGSLTTRWSTGAAQAAGQWYQVDLGSSVWFNQVMLDGGTSAGDYARRYIVQVSSDGSTWTEVANGEGLGQVVTANFPITQARFIKITQTGSSGSWWSIAELRVFQ